MSLKSLWFLPLAAVMALSPAPAQTAQTELPASHDATLARQLDEARQQLATQAALLQQMQAELARQAEAINQLRSQQQAAFMPTGISGSEEDAPRLQNAVLMMRAGQPALQPVVALARPAQAAKPAADQPGELFFRLGNAKFTPGGWFDFTTLYRSTDVGSGLGTTLQSIPYNNTVTGALSEVRMSAQASRLTMRVEEQIRKARIFGYAEADFIGYLPSNAYVSTNANTFRMRVFYTNLAWGKWELLGGQAWSLITPTRKSLSPYVADLFISNNIDNSYQAGLAYARQAQIRLVYHATPSIAAALSLENAQQYTGSAVTFPSLFSNTEADIGSSTSSGGATATPNLHPDIVTRLSLDHPVRGLPWHFGLAGLVTPVGIVTPVSVTKTVTVKDTREGAGVAGEFNLQLAKKIRTIATGYWSSGGGRYIGGTGPAFVVLQNGSTTSPFSAALLHSGSGIAGFEWLATRKTTVSAFGSAIYFQRRYGLDPKTSSYVGYGFPGSTNSNNRVIREYTLATNNTLWQSPLFGAVQFITQTSYLWRAPWYVASDSPRDAHNVMQFVSLRYVIP